MIFINQENIMQMEQLLFQRIVNKLTFSCGSMPETGLLSGKMGVVIFFFHYARYTGNILHEDFAEILLESVYKNIHTTMPVNFESGYCGIGWGIEYLIQQNFVEAESDGVLTDLDAKIMERDPRRITDYSLATGLEGIICYVLSRLISDKKEQNSKPFDSVYLSDLFTAAKKMPKTEITSSFIDYVEKKELKYDIQIVLHNLIASSNINKDEEYANWKLGLEKGCCGVALKHILK